MEPTPAEVRGALSQSSSNEMLASLKKPWSMKRMHRLIVLSATYRQSSSVTPELFERNPDNRLLARGPRVRLSAEGVPRHAHCRQRLAES